MNLDFLNEKIKTRDFDSIYEWYNNNIKILDFNMFTSSHFQFCVAALIKQKDYEKAKNLSSLARKRFVNNYSILNLHIIINQKLKNKTEEIEAISQLFESDKFDLKSFNKYAIRYAELNNIVYGREILFLDDNNCIQLIKNEKNVNNILFVTFFGSKKDIKSTKDLIFSHGYAHKFVLDSGYDLLVVNSKKYQYYQDLDLSDFAQATEHIIGSYTKIYSYGGSGGGYAALYYGMALNAIPITFSPRVRIDPCTKLRILPPEVKFSHKFLSDYVTDSAAYIIYDPLVEGDNNYVNARVLPCYSNATLIEVPYMGHGAFYLAEIDHVKKIIYQIVNDEHISIDLNKRKKSKIYHYNFALDLFKKQKILFGVIICLRGLLLSEYPTKYDKVHIYNLLIKNLIKHNYIVLSLTMMESCRKYDWFMDIKNDFQNEKSILEKIKKSQKNFKNKEIEKYLTNWNNYS